MDVIFDLRTTFAEKPEKQLDELDEALVYLARYGRMNPEWVESLDVSRMESLMGKVNAWVKRENGVREADPLVNDTGGDWT